LTFFWQISGKSGGAQKRMAFKVIQYTETKKVELTFFWPISGKSGGAQKLMAYKDIQYTETKNRLMAFKDTIHRD
jgi:hypothetical protein